ncbi:4Fe-4S binding protein [Parabacteroides sp. Marseille-P3160]|uniref:4Fe-4S binding protein n=1 Tax=Parabacteroides sp. Marseille-P3160 TaxID=1917887 RepID=UPI0009B994B5
MFWKKKDRGVAFVHADKCVGCGKCVKICRHHVLEMVAAENGKRAIANNTGRCTGCGKCVAICPQRTIGINF